MAAAVRASNFLSRISEREYLDTLLAGVRAGDSAALVLRGEAGVGKTALLRYAERQAVGFRTADTAGVEAEMELPFAGMHRLCAPMLDRLDALPAPQREALQIALGVATGNPPDRFLLSLATLSLLSAVAEERPLLCLLDDAQWLDGASAEILTFVARRLVAESMAIVFAVREPAAAPHFEGLPQLPVRGLDERAAHALLSRAIPGRIDARVRDRIIAEARGNPLALLELPRGMSAVDLAGGYEVPAVGDLPGRLESHYLARVEALPEATQRLLLLAAADPVGDAALVWRAARYVGLGADALRPAEDADLLTVGAQVRFRHPLVRSAVYRAASSADRRAVHRALADATDAHTDRDRRAWHRAAAAGGLDEHVASELERCADRARARGGLAAAAAFLRRSVALTPDRDRRTERAMAGAQASLQAGALDAALEMLATVESAQLDDLQRARVDLLRGQISFAQGSAGDAASLLLAAAQRLERLDLALARETYLYVCGTAMFGGDQSAGDLLAAARAVRALPRPPGPPRAVDTLLDGIALLVTDGRAAAAPMLLRATSAFSGDGVPVDECLRWSPFATAAGNALWDDDGVRAVCARQVRIARDAGALGQLPAHLLALGNAAARGGDFAATASHTAEANAITEATGTRHPPYTEMLVLAMRGCEAEAVSLTERTIEQVASAGQGIATTAYWSRAILYNGLGRYEDARAAAETASSAPLDMFAAMWSLPELVESATRTEAVDVARHAVERLTETTRPAGTDWGLGIEARSRALVSEGAVAEGLYQEAIERLQRTKLRADLARAHLLYGEWLRREHRRADARAQLRVAHALFMASGMEAFAERARVELVATGETVRRRTDDTRDELTPQERQIARLARDGLSNPEIGARLFLSPRTVEWHLRKVFIKLEIRSRHELSSALPSSESELAPA
ncbi:MAG TPA: AAA family ATPase [Solirubrobacteraceae bacterium]|nr:AAA family ATPase [Solirubrobacteraceae bacterium]